MSVTVVKNEATGQRSNNLITAVWQSADEKREFESRINPEETGQYMLPVIEEPDAVPELTQTQQTREQERGKDSGVIEKATSWFKKIATK